jgi:predicted 3-demethylubiquinone-9 3-methyltransferase (glyoxalase superfamily)
MPNITPHLWFDTQAEEAAKFYVGLFENSEVKTITRYTKAGFEVHGQPEGKVMTVEFELAGQKFIGLNGGPVFKFTPAISFLIACTSKEEVDHFWSQLNQGGTALMELAEYPFSEKYGWTADRYGLSWQIMYMGDIPFRQKIVPALMFVGEQAGKAETAMKFYTSIFEDSNIGNIMRYEAGEEPDKVGTIKHAVFTLAGQDFNAMDSAHEHKFSFNEAVSLMVPCDTQAEVDHYWDKLSVGGDAQAQQCGWLKDQYGVSWQVAPTILDQMMKDPDPQKVERVTNAFLKMKKFDIAELEKAFQG